MLLAILTSRQKRDGKEYFINLLFYKPGVSVCMRESKRVCVCVCVCVDSVCWLLRVTFATSGDWADDHFYKLSHIMDI